MKAETNKVISARRTKSKSTSTKNGNNALSPIASSLIYNPTKNYISKSKILSELAINKESYIIIEDLKKETGLNLSFLAEHIFEMTPKTLFTYREKGKYLPKRSVENSLKLKELYQKGKEIFGSREAFNKWLAIESYGMGKIVPLSIIGYATGIDLIYEELVRIEFGATA